MALSLFSGHRKVFSNGLIDAPQEEREFVAVYETGEIYFASGKKFSEQVRTAQTYVRKTLGKTPVMTEVNGPDVMAHYERVAHEGAGDKSESHERLADRILRDAANSKAADIKIIRTPERTVVRFIIVESEIR